MQAIGQYFGQKEDLEMMYLSSSSSSRIYRRDSTQYAVKFRKRYRRQICRLIDDIQFLAGKRTIAGGIFSHL